MSEPDSSGSSYFSFMAVLSALIGIAWFVAGLFGLAPFGVQSALFGVAMLFAGSAGALGFLVQHRMKLTGYDVQTWGDPMRTLKLYSDYWRIAPEKGWSRVPIVGMWSGLLAAGVFLVASALKLMPAG